MAAPFDYSGLVATADELISQFGRPVTLRLPAQGAADVAKPFGARATGNDVELTGVRAAFLQPRDADRANTEIGNVTDRALIPAADLAGNELGRLWRVVDGTREFEVLEARPIQPGPTLVYVEVLLSR